VVIKSKKYLKENLGKSINLKVDKSKGNSERKIKSIRGKVIGVGENLFTIETGKSNEKYKESFRYAELIDGSVALCIKI